MVSSLAVRPQSTPDSRLILTFLKVQFSGRRSNQPFTRIEIQHLTHSQLRQDIERSTQLAVEAALEEMRGIIDRFTRQAYVHKTWLTLDEAARYADITTATLRTWRENGLPEAPVEGRIYIKREHLDGWIESHLEYPEKQAA